MIEFKKYSKIQDISGVKSKIEEWAQWLPENGWIALEKVHGANFQFAICGNEVQVGCRSKFLDNPGSFYRADICVDRLLPTMQSIGKKYAGHTVRLFGELFGGHYPHKEVITCKHIHRIQKGVWYSPDIHFYLFDVMIDDKLLPHTDVINIGNQFDLFTAEPLAIGKLSDMLDLDPVFKTTIPSRLGLPPIKDNIAEGYVIKPNKPLFFRNGNRIIFKIKNERFAEKKAKRERRKQALSDIISDSAISVYTELKRYITENRLNNILSHGDKFDNFHQIQGAFMKDIIEEARNDGIELKPLAKSDKKVITRTLMKDIANVIRPHIHKIIGE